LEALARKDPDLRLLKIDIGKWGSPVAEQYRIKRLPTVWLYENSKIATRDVREAMRKLEGK
jgi:hypothetical protein